MDCLSRFRTIDGFRRALKYVLNSHKKKKYRLSIPHVMSFGENDKKEIFPIPPFQGFMYCQLLSQPGPMFQSLLVRKNALRRIGDLDEEIVSWQEWDTSIRLAEHFPFGFVAEPTFIYDCRGGNTISQNRLHAAIGYEQIIHKHASAIRKFAGVAVSAEALSRNCVPLQPGRTTVCITVSSNDDVHLCKDSFCMEVL